ncbi:MAG: hypothetical protein V4629_02360 [Pseudomonadota bacterium]
MKIRSYSKNKIEPSHKLDEMIPSKLLKENLVGNQSTTQIKSAKKSKNENFSKENLDFIINSPYKSGKNKFITIKKLVAVSNVPEMTEPPSLSKIFGVNLAKKIENYVDLNVSGAKNLKILVSEWIAANPIDLERIKNKPAIIEAYKKAFLDWTQDCTNERREVEKSEDLKRYEDFLTEEEQRDALIEVEPINYLSQSAHIGANLSKFGDLRIETKAAIAKYSREYDEAESKGNLDNFRKNLGLPIFD